MVFEAGNASEISRNNPALEKLWKSRFRRPRPNIPIHITKIMRQAIILIELTAQHIS